MTPVRRWRYFTDDELLVIEWCFDHMKPKPDCRIWRLWTEILDERIYREDGEKEGGSVNGKHS